MTTADGIFDNAWAASGQPATDDQILRGVYDDSDTAVAEHFREPPEPLGGAETEPPTLDPNTTLPPAIRSFVINVAEHLQVPVEAPASVAIAALSTAAAGRAWIHGRSGWYQPLVIWTCTTMRSGERKSDTVRIVAYPIRQAEREAIKTWKAERGRETAEKEELGAKEKRLKEQLKTAKGNQANNLQRGLEATQEQLRNFSGDQPPMPRLLVENTTVEALQERLEDNHERLGVLSAEGGIFTLVAGKYNKNDMPDLDIYLKSFDEEHLPIDRVMRGTVILHHPALAVGLLVQPHVLDKAVAVPGMHDRGFLARFFFGAPQSMLGHRAVDAPAMLRGNTEAWEEVIQGILALPPRPDPLFTLELDDRAAKLLRELREHLEPHLDPATGRYGYMTDWAGKLAGKVLRLAGLYHLAQGYGRERMVDEETMTYAIAFGLWALRHAEHVHRNWRKSDTGPGVAPILAWLRKKQPETFTARDLRVLQNASWYTTDARDEALTQLHRAGWIASVAHHGNAGRRRPTAAFVTHPSLRKAKR